MTRNEIIEKLKENFSIRELVCPHTYKKYGEKAWMFLTTEILHTLLVLRTDILNVPLYCNTYKDEVKKDDFTQRGLRCNLCELCASRTKKNQLYLSAHHNGCGLDLVSPKMTAAEMRKRIKQQYFKLPYNVRIEDNGNGRPTWLHIDTYDTGEPISTFVG